MSASRCGKPVPFRGTFVGNLGPSNANLGCPIRDFARASFRRLAWQFEMLAKSSARREDEEVSESSEEPPLKRATSVMRSDAQRPFFFGEVT